MSTPIFEQLLAEFIEQSQYCRLRIGPLVGEGFEEVEVIDEYFGTTGSVTRIIEVEESTGMTEIETDKPGTKLYMTDGIKLYVVNNAPELVTIDPPAMSMLDDTQTLPITNNHYAPKSMAALEDLKKVVEQIKQDEIDISPRLYSRGAHKKSAAPHTFPSLFSRTAA